MKSKLLLYLGLTGSVLIGLWVVGAVVRWKQPQIQLPATQIEKAFDAVSEKRQAELEAEAKAKTEAVSSDALVAAHAAIKGSLSDWKQADAAIACARAGALFTKWQTWSSKTGQPLEVIYRDELAAHLLRVHTWQQRTNAGISGDATHVAEARAIVGDTQVILALGDLLYSQQSAPLCDNRVDSEVVKLNQVYSEVAARVDTRDTQLRQLENDQVAAVNNYWSSVTGTEPAAAGTEPVKADNPLLKLMFGEKADGQH